MVYMRGTPFGGFSLFPLESVRPPRVVTGYLVVDSLIETIDRYSRGEGVLPYVTLTGTCGPIRYGFQGVLS